MIDRNTNASLSTNSPYAYTFYSEKRTVVFGPYGLKGGMKTPDDDENDRDKATSTRSSPGDAIKSPFGCPEKIEFIMNIVSIVLSIISLILLLKNNDTLSSYNDNDTLSSSSMVPQPHFENYTVGRDRGDRDWKDTLESAANGDLGTVARDIIDNETIQRSSTRESVPEGTWTCDERDEEAEIHMEVMKAEIHVEIVIETGTKK